MMITGRTSAQPASRNARSTSPPGLRGGDAIVSLRTSHHQVTTSDAAEHQAGEDAGEEQLRDRDVGGDAEDDEADARRNDRRDDPGRGDQAGRARLVVAGRDHHRQQQRRQRGGVGDRRAGQRREQARRRRSSRSRGRP